MKLNTRLQTAQQSNNSSPVVLIHGLFGSLDNLGVLARDLGQNYTLLQVDLRNHGLSPRSEEMSYRAMAADILETLDASGIDKVIIIGHSMGGKVAMALTALAPDRVEKLVVIDIAPVAYHVHRHQEIFQAIHAVTEAGATTRQQATEIMQRIIDEAGVIQFYSNHLATANGNSMCRYWKRNMKRLLAGSQCLAGHIRFCLFAVETLLILKSVTAKNSRNSSRSPVPMSLLVPVIGSMLKNQTLFCGQFIVFLILTQRID